MVDSARRPRPVHYDLSYGGDVYPSYLSGQNPARAAAGSILEPATSPWALSRSARPTGAATRWSRSPRAGPTIDGRVKPDLLGFDGVSVHIADVQSDRGRLTGPTGFYGTSAAAPHVAGAAALVLAANPTMDAADIEAFLQGRTSPHVSPATNHAGAGATATARPGRTPLRDLPGTDHACRPRSPSVAGRGLHAPSPPPAPLPRGVGRCQDRRQGGRQRCIWHGHRRDPDVGHFNPRVQLAGHLLPAGQRGVPIAGGVGVDLGRRSTLKYSTAGLRRPVPARGQRSTSTACCKNYSNSAAGLVHGSGRTVLPAALTSTVPGRPCCRAPRSPTALWRSASSRTRCTSTGWSRWRPRDLGRRRARQSHQLRPPTGLAVSPCRASVRGLVGSQARSVWQNGRLSTGRRADPLTERQPVPQDHRRGVPTSRRSGPSLHILE